MNGMVVPGELSQNTNVALLFLTIHEMPDFIRCLQYLYSLCQVSTPNLLDPNPSPNRFEKSIPVFTSVIPNSIPNQIFHIDKNAEAPTQERCFRGLLPHETANNHIRIRHGANIEP